LYLEFTVLVVRSSAWELKGWQLNPTVGFMNNGLSNGLVSLLIWSMPKVRRKIHSLKYVWVVFGIHWFSGAFTCFGVERVAVEPYCWLYEKGFEHWFSIFVNLVNGKSAQKNVWIQTLWVVFGLVVRSLTFELKEWQFNHPAGFGSVFGMH
jgi:hypothetical protein